MQIHDSARTNFDKRADELRGKLQPLEPEAHVSGRRGFSADVEIAGEITEADIIGEIHMSTVDARGEVIERVVAVDGRRFKLAGDDYAALRRLSESIASALGRDVWISADTVENAVLEWMTKGTEPSTSMTTYVLSTLESEIDSRVVCVPIATLQLEVPLSVGTTTIAQCEWRLFEEWKAAALSKQEGDPEELERHFMRLAKKIRGYAVASVPLEGDIRATEQVALDRATDACALLRMFSAAALIPQQRSYCAPLGQEGIQRCTVFRVKSGSIVGLTDKILGPAPVSWGIDRRTLEQMHKLGLQRLIDAYAKENRSDCEETILESVLLYSRVTMLADPADKLVYALTSLERMFLRDQSEPIQQNLAERIARLIGHDVQSRKAIISEIKEAYGHRSRFLHHGRRSSDLRELESIMSIAWNALLAVVPLLDRFAAKVELLSALDDEKMA